MSGHSKWANIHRKKEANDKVKGSIFTKMAKAITIAVKKGGNIMDPDMNFALRLAVDKAKAVNMPKENIDRAIAKGGKSGEGSELVELTIEGFAPGGVAIIAEAVTDNRNRTVAELRTLMEKNGGRMGELGSVSYMFERVGIIGFRGNITQEAELELIDLGLLDLWQEKNEGLVYTQPESVHAVVAKLKEFGMQEVEGNLGYRGKGPNIEVDMAKIENFMAIIREHEDVGEVYVNLV